MAPTVREMAFVGGLAGGLDVRRSDAVDGRRSQRLYMVSDVKIPRSQLPLTRRGPVDPQPNYDEYDKNILNEFFMKRFQRALEKDAMRRNDPVSYDRIIELSKSIHKSHLDDPAMVRYRVEGIFHEIFGSMLPALFKSMFAGPMPAVSEQMAAVATSLGSQWLMGPNKLENNFRTVHIERCRFLEEAGCVNVCVNGCKKPTEAFIKNAMGIDLYIEPNYDDFSCQFKFGEKPPPEALDPALSEPCFLQCPTASKMMKSKGFVEGSKCENTPYTPNRSVQ